ncbi:MAG: dockerin type I domain-containing protein [Pirellulales bacterium]|nr:dockerin type I domain-containing protein [Pirellulales bacterium]
MNSYHRGGSWRLSDVTVKVTVDHQISRWQVPQISFYDNDTIDASTTERPLIVFGGQGADTISTGTKDDLVLGDRGRTLFFGDGNELNRYQLEYRDLVGLEEHAVMVFGHGGPGDVNDSSHHNISYVTTVDDAIGGPDTITAQDGLDIAFGGYGMDTIDASSDSAANDVIIGDNGSALYMASQLIDVRSSSPLVGSDDTLLAGAGANAIIGGAGRDVIESDGDDANDILSGDNAIVEFTRLSDGTVYPKLAYTIAPEVGGSDTITAGDGRNIILGGSHNDQITGGNGSESDIIIGDNGLVRFVEDVLVEARTTDFAFGGDDIIVAGQGSDYVIGGASNDTIDADDPNAPDSSADYIIGDDGYALFTDTGLITEISTQAPELGGTDTIDAGNGPDVILGGSERDYINTISGENNSVTVGRIDTYRDVILGDNGTAVFDVASGESRLQSIFSTAYNLGGSDIIWSGNGSDIVIGGSGSDEILTHSSGEHPDDASRDIVIGDNGKAEFDVSVPQLDEANDYVFVVTAITTLADSIGADDYIFVGKGQDIVLGGAGADYVNYMPETSQLLNIITNDIAIQRDQSRDIVIGDNGYVHFHAYVEGQSLDVVSEFSTTSDHIGGNDFILTDGGADIVLGGFGSDYITAANPTLDDGKRDIVLGDNGYATFSTGEVIESFTSTSPAIGGNDQILVGDGNDIVIGGPGVDLINTDIPEDLLANLLEAASIELSISDDLTTLTVVTTGVNAESFTSEIDLSANSPYLLGDDSGADIVLGDNGVIHFHKGVEFIAESEVIHTITTIAPETGTTDLIYTDGGDDIVVGGSGADLVIAHDTSDDNPDTDFVFGDNGIAIFDASEDKTTEIARRITSLDFTYGSTDIITTGRGPDIVVAGHNDDFVHAGIAGQNGDESRDIVIGDDADLILDAHGLPAEIISIATSTGGDDTIHTGGGSDIAFGGFGKDVIRTNGTTALRDRDVVIGDNGHAVFETHEDETNASSPWTTVREIRTIDDAVGSDDVIYTAFDSDIILGGTANDIIWAFDENNDDDKRDIVLGDSGEVLFDADEIITNAISTSPSIGGVDVIMVGQGSDIVIGGADSDYINIYNDGSEEPTTISSNDSGNDVVTGDNAKIVFHPGYQQVRRIETIAVEHGDNDWIYTDNGADIVFGGSADDWIRANNVDSDNKDQDVILGDNGAATFLSGGSENSVEIPTWISSQSPEIGGDDIIFSGRGPDIVIGGQGNDDINAGDANQDNLSFHDDSRDLVLGDNGFIDLDNHGNIEYASSIATSIGGNDTISTGGGSDVVFGGYGSDTINTSGIPADTRDRDVVLGDSGEATFDSLTYILRDIRTLTDSIGDADQIETAFDADIVFGGIGSDYIVTYSDNDNDDGSRDIVAGDNGYALFDELENIEQIETTSTSIGGDDHILVGDGDDIVLGGFGTDQVNVNVDNEIVSNAATSDKIRFDLATATITLTTYADDDSEADSTQSFTLDQNNIFDGLDTGDDLVIGDNGSVLFHSIDSSNTAFSIVNNVQTTAPALGSPDLVFTDDGNDIVIGGMASDWIVAHNFDNASQDDDFVLGDNGQLVFENDASIWTATSTDTEIGGPDWISTGRGADLVVGGATNDVINAGTDLILDVSRDIVLGDSGFVQFDHAGRIDYIESVDAAIGGPDIIDTGGGPDVVLGGMSGDVVNTEQGNDIVLGDSGVATFNSDLDNLNDDSHIGILRSIHTIAPSIGGDDVINTDEGTDIILGGSADDTITTYSLDESDRDIVLGDNGEVIFIEDGHISTATSWDPAIGGRDMIYTGNGNDIVFGGTDNDLIETQSNLASDSDKDIVTGDSAFAVFDNTGVLLSVTTDLTESGQSQPATDIGGDDVITTGSDIDVVIGGAEKDTITTGSDDDYVLGDNGRLLTTVNDDNSSTVDRLITIAPNHGSDDIIRSGSEYDVVIGGTANDEIHGGDHHDILLGDHGLYDTSLPANQTYLAIYVENKFDGGDDEIHGNAGDDFIIGQQGQDTIFGDAGDDDIAGGHNVIGGHDGDDVIHGGDNSDVILGDNGRLLREFRISPEERDLWVRYPDPYDFVQLDDVVRSVHRYDDVEFMLVDDQSKAMHGNDTIHGDEGHDIVHAQRGDDTVFGGQGDDELLGQLGDDTIEGDEGHDTVLGDNGEILRDYVTTQEPRLNENNMWHRDVVLQNYGSVTRMIEMSDMQDGITSEDIDRILAADWVVTLGRYDSLSERVTTNSNWQTYAVLVDAYNPHDDVIAGGGGDDLLVGQRGNDTIEGDGGNDLILGDNAHFTSATAMELPQLFTGMQLFSDNAVPSDAIDANLHSTYTATTLGLSYLDNFYRTTTPFWLDATESQNSLSITHDGSFILPASSVVPEELSLNDPYLFARTFGNIVSHEFTEATEQLQNGILRDRYITTGPSTILVPYASITPRIVGNEHVLAGDDLIAGGDGQDWIFGDTATLYTGLLTGMHEVDQLADSTRTEIQLLQHSLSSLAADRSQLQHWEQAYTTKSITVGNDTIAGDGQISDGSIVEIVVSDASQSDTIVGDNAHILTGIEQGIPANSYRYQTALLDAVSYLGDLKTIISDLEALVFAGHDSTLRDILAKATNPLTNFESDPIYTLSIGNDAIDGGHDADLVTGDHGVIILPTVEGLRYIHSAVDIPSNNDEAIEATHNKIVANEVAWIAHKTRTALKKQPLTASQLESIPLPAEYPMLIGNDILSGNDGDDTIFGDFSIHVLPVIYSGTFDRIITAITSEDSVESVNACIEQSTSVAEKLECIDGYDAYQFALTRFMEELFTDIEQYLRATKHFQDYRILESHYDHPFYGRRSNEMASSVLIAGNDLIHGNNGNDVLLGDSASIYTDYMISGGVANMITTGNPDGSFYDYHMEQKLESKFMQRENFETIGHYTFNEEAIATNDRSLIEGIANDVINGGDGNDIIYGQNMNDQINGDSGADILFGGGGANTLDDDNAEDPDLDRRDGSDDRPKLSNLRAVKESTFEITKHWLENIAQDMVEDDTVRNENILPYDVLAGNFVVSDEEDHPHSWDDYLVVQNELNPHDVNDDGHISPLDVLLIINKLNELSEANLPLTFNGLNAKGDPSIFLDTSGDGELAPHDALLVINTINDGADAEGEGGSIHTNSIENKSSVTADGVFNASFNEPFSSFPEQSNDYHTNAVSDAIDELRSPEMMPIKPGFQDSTELFSENWLELD